MSISTALKRFGVGNLIVPDLYLIAWWLNEIAQPVAIISGVVILVSNTIKRR